MVNRISLLTTKFKVILFGEGLYFCALVNLHFIFNQQSRTQVILFAFQTLAFEMQTELKKSLIENFAGEILNQ